MEIKQNERIDNLQYKGLKIIQDTNGFCFGIDSVLLSDFAKGIKNVIIAGGVSANKYLRNEITKVIERNSAKVSIPEFKYCTDNAAMIGAAGYFAYKRGRRGDLTLSAKATDPLH